MSIFESIYVTGYGVAHFIRHWYIKIFWWLSLWVALMFEGGVINGVIPLRAIFPIAGVFTIFALIWIICYICEKREQDKEDKYKRARK